MGDRQNVRLGEAFFRPRESVFAPAREVLNLKDGSGGDGAGTDRRNGRAAANAQVTVADPFAVPDGIQRHTAEAAEAQRAIGRQEIAGQKMNFIAKDAVDPSFLKNRAGNELSLEELAQAVSQPWDETGKRPEGLGMRGRRGDPQEMSAAQLRLAAERKEAAKRSQTGQSVSIVVECATGLEISQKENERDEWGKGVYGWRAFFDEEQRQSNECVSKKLMRPIKVSRPPTEEFEMTWQRRIPFNPLQKSEMNFDPVTQLSEQKGSAEHPNQKPSKLNLEDTRVVRRPIELPLSRPTYTTIHLPIEAEEDGSLGSELSVLFLLVEQVGPTPDRNLHFDRLVGWNCLKVEKLFPRTKREMHDQNMWNKYRGLLDHSYPRYYPDTKITPEIHRSNPVGEKLRAGKAEAKDMTPEDPYNENLLLPRDAMNPFRHFRGEMLFVRGEETTAILEGSCTVKHLLPTKEHPLGFVTVRLRSASKVKASEPRHRFLRSGGGRYFLEACMVRVPGEMEPKKDLHSVEYTTHRPWIKFNRNVFGPYFGRPARFGGFPMVEKVFFSPEIPLPSLRNPQKRDKLYLDILKFKPSQKTAEDAVKDPEVIGTACIPLTEDNRNMREHALMKFSGVGVDMVQKGRLGGSVRLRAVQDATYKDVQMPYWSKSDAEPFEKSLAFPVLDNLLANSARKITRWRDLSDAQIDLQRLEYAGRRDGGKSLLASDAFSHFKLGLQDHLKAQAKGKGKDEETGMLSLIHSHKDAEEYAASRQPGAWRIGVPRGPQGQRGTTRADRIEEYYQWASTLQENPESPLPPDDIPQYPHDGPSGQPQLALPGTAHPSFAPLAAHMLPTQIYGPPIVSHQHSRVSSLGLPVRPHSRVPSATQYPAVVAGGGHSRGPSYTFAQAPAEGGIQYVQMPSSYQYAPAASVPVPVPISGVSGAVDNSVVIYPIGSASGTVPVERPGSASAAVGLSGVSTGGLAPPQARGDARGWPGLSQSEFEPN
uniref:Uncharacterized protein n=1 Tax=Chromera velia CCMP2878 TaxID=1169474 RepID=A0A0G4H871_9ALVE|eukprot:Cvel_5866.t1-p1 / transcript=Cvel_5866.t1 / gene=Cvel_5866 / organism=Chromera_velia_CCMP2878 / gene_product=hypothetical protein / transcript_product=hypothetical protein / location=Cvel_scaffold279:31865-40507(+) / protein_length=989 / sequence_SO=supercontig / SO=protein_coding / is_pseudo=false